MFRSGKRWDKTPWPRVGGVVKVRGQMYNRSEISNMFYIAASDIEFLPFSQSDDTPTTKRRRFMKKSRDEPESPSPVDPSGSGSGTRQGKARANKDKDTAAAEA